jgi:O-antigen ligase
VHTAIAMVFLTILPLATTPRDIAFGVLCGVAVIRLRYTWRCYALLWRRHLTWACLLWVFWGGLSLAWSQNVPEGFAEWGAARVLLLPLLLWPILDRIPVLIGALLTGVLIQNGLQLADVMGWADLSPVEQTGRSGGLLHPGHVGLFSMAAMCWSLNVLLCGPKRGRITGCIFLCAAAFGLLAAGSRGTWLAALMAVPGTLAVIAVCEPTRRRSAVVLGIVGIVAVAGSWPLTGPKVTARINAAIQDVHGARHDNEYWTDVGTRLGLWRWSMDIFRHHPIRGAGVGSFETALDDVPHFVEARAYAATVNPDYPRRLQRMHPHSVYLRALALTGIVGAGTLLVMLWVIGRQVLGDRVDHPYALAAGTIFLGWLIGAAFDCFAINGFDLGLLAVLVTLTLRGRPAIRYDWRACSDEERAALRVVS